MRLTDVLRTNTFRTAAMACAAFGAATLLLFGFIYWQTAGLETQRIDGFVMHEFMALAREHADAMAADVNSRYGADLHRQSFAAIFGTDGVPLAGGLTAMPLGLPSDGRAHDIDALRSGGDAVERERVRAVAGRLPDGKLLVVGRSVQDLETLRLLVLHALWLGLLPALVAALGIGLFASQRTIARVHDINATIGRVMQGYLHERLPSAGTKDALDQLTESCNRMLDEIERLLGEVKGVGDNIAHDLRTPLARVRSRLESGRRRASGLAELKAVVDSAIGDLDQSFAIITALLRIGELEAGRRTAGFTRVELCAIVREAAELYAPLAEARGLSLDTLARADRHVLGDRELLLEAVVNLLDNAVKFAPPGGHVRLSVEDADAGPFIRVADSGAGIAPEERDAVLERFRRGTRGRHAAGTGVGLSLVGAILRLHNFGLRMHNPDGLFAVDILCGAGLAG